MARKDTIRPVGMLPEAKKKLLDAAMQLMLKQGYSATSVDEICQAAGLTKGSFFHYFQSKEELAKAAIGHFSSYQQQFFDQAPDRHSPDPLKRIRGRLDLMAGLCRQGCDAPCCLVGNLTQEMAVTHPEIRECCAQIFDAAEAEFRRDLEEAFAARAAARPAPRSGRAGKSAAKTAAPVAAAKVAASTAQSADARTLAGLYMSLIQGSLLLAKARQDASILTANIEHFRRYLQTLLAQDQE